MPIDAPKFVDLRPLKARTNLRRHPQAEPERNNQRDREYIANRVESAIAELHNLQDLLLSDDVDPRLLMDLRDALNRTRNTAWAVQQYLACVATETDATTLMQVLAVERIRVAYQLGQLLLKDLQSPDLRLQPGQLLELYRVMKELTARLQELVG